MKMKSILHFSKSTVLKGALMMLLLSCGFFTMEAQTTLVPMQTLNSDNPNYSGLSAQEITAIVYNVSGTTEEVEEVLVPLILEIRNDQSPYNEFEQEVRDYFYEQIIILMSDKPGLDLASALTRAYYHAHALVEANPSHAHQVDLEQILEETADLFN